MLLKIFSISILIRYAVFSFVHHPTPLFPPIMLHCLQSTNCQNLPHIQSHGQSSVCQNMENNFNMYIYVFYATKINSRIYLQLQTPKCKTESKYKVFKNNGRVSSNQYFDLNDESNTFQHGNIPHVYHSHPCTC